MTEPSLPQKRRRANPLFAFKTALVAHRGSVTCVAFSPVNNTFVSASHNGGIRLWDASMEPPKKMAFVKGHEGAVHTLTFSPDGKTLVSACECGRTVVWSVEGGSLKNTINLGATTNAWSMAFSHGKMTIALGVGSYLHQVHLYDVSGDTAIFKGVLPTDSGEVNSLAFSHDNKILVSGCSDSTVKLWDVSRKAPKVKGTLRGHSGAVSYVVFSPDNKTLATASDDRTIKLWDWKAGSLQGTVVTGHSDDVNCVIFSPDNSILASCSCDNTIKLWNVSGDAFEELDTLSGSSGRASLNYVYSVAFSADNKTMIAATDEGRVIIWERA